MILLKITKKSNNTDKKAAPVQVMAYFGCFVVLSDIFDNKNKNEFYNYLRSEYPDEAHYKERQNEDLTKK